MGFVCYYKLDKRNYRWLRKMIEKKFEGPSGWDYKINPWLVGAGIIVGILLFALWSQNEKYVSLQWEHEKDKALINKVMSGLAVSSGLADADYETLFIQNYSRRDLAIINSSVYTYGAEATLYSYVEGLIKPPLMDGHQRADEFFGVER
jgi:hypothetical protein